MNAPWVLAVVAAIATLGAGAGFWSLFTVGATKRKLVAEAESLTASTVNMLNRSAMELMEPFRQRVRELEAEAKEARREATAAREEISNLRTQVADLTAVMRSLRAAILDPSASVDGLRLLVSDQNGRTG